MKNILVLAGGADSDEAVFVTALAAARPLGAHLEFCHLQVDPGEAAAWEPHSEFVRGSGIREMLGRLQAESITRTAAARGHFEQFCKHSAIVVGAEARADGGVSASWHEETGDAERFIFCARHHDLIVVGRRTGPNGLPPDLIETLLLSSGRPLLIAPEQPPSLPVGTVVVCWKETAEAARAVAAAMPLLIHAKRVVLVGVKERDPSLADGLVDLSHQLAWHGINAEVDFISSVAGPVRKVLLAAARSYHADLLVMGAYGHSRTRQVVFGGFTRSVLETADLAVFLMH
jgi:nucleotide-binding universal stress UspA family protein